MSSITAMYITQCAKLGFSSVNQSSIVGLGGILGRSYIGAMMTGQVRRSCDPHHDVILHHHHRQ